MIENVVGRVKTIYEHGRKASLSESEFRKILSEENII
jgi:hypothetical protein